MFRLARLSMRNRAVVALVTIAIIVGGVFAMGSLKRELIPSLQIPMAGVIATYPGASAAIVEQQVAEPVEGAIRSVAGVESVETTSMNSVAIAMVSFRYGTDMDVANQKLSTAVTRLSGSLPDDAETQVIAGSMDDIPIVQLAVSADDDAASDLAHLAQSVDSVLVPELSQLPGVRSVDVSGYEQQEVLIALDTQAMGAAGVPASAVADVLKNNGLAFPAGTITEGDESLVAQIGSPLTTVAELETLPLVVAGDSGEGDGASPDAAGQASGASSSMPSAPVLLGDIATVTVGPASATSYSRIDARDAVAVAVTKTPDGNTVDVSHAVADTVADLADVLEADGLTVAVAFDQAPFIEDSVTGLATEGAGGLVFAVIVILVFLVSLRSTLVSAVSIPLSLLVAFVAMRVTGQTLNMLTLAALTMAIGRVVDDSIVVIENIKRHLSYGEEKSAAILGAIREVAGAIAASTVCTVAVFAPLALVGGMVGELFRPFGLTITIALLASLAVALTIVPVLAYWFVKTPVTVDAADQAAQRSQAEAAERRGLWQRAYIPTLRGALAHPIITLVVAVAILGGTVALVPHLETNVLGDMGSDTITVTETFEPGTSLDAQDRDARKIENALAGVEEVATVQTTVGGGGMMGFSLGTSQPTATFSVTLTDDADPASAEAAVREAVGDLGGERSTGITLGGMEATMMTSTVDLVVRGPDADALADAARAVEERVRTVPGAVEVSNNMAEDTPAIQITADRQAAAALGMTETAVEAMVAGLMTPSTIGTLDLADGRVNVKLAMGGEDGGSGVTSLESLKALPLGAGPGGVIRLADIATVEEVNVPAARSRVDGQRSATVSVTPETQDLGTLSGRLSDAVAELDLPAGVSVEVGGVAARQSEAFSDMGLALVLAIAIVFIVMVATFGSLLQPFILLVSIPFAATGALVALLLSGTALGVAALIGVLMLVGIVVSNAIVLIDLINQYRRRGRELDDAIESGARKRLRPIVMTALATIFALVPMAVGITGEGAFISQPLALVVIGGLVSSTLLTLIVVPVLYRFEAMAHDRRIARREARLDARRAERAAARDAAAPVPAIAGAGGE
ncbi:MAG: efflux RND transporter permease subunit [Bifidobacteriaceae bacterium]|nr:efflux RND transporter permease subunit [Bifidobacteriaceae bacterium]